MGGFSIYSTHDRGEASRSPMGGDRAVVLLVSSMLLTGAANGQDGGKKVDQPSRFPEIEFVGSDVFRSGTYLQPLWKELHFEGHYFGAITNVGYTGAGWAFRLGKLLLVPGFGVAFGDDDFTTTPTASFRWEFEKDWFVTQGMVLQCFRSSPIVKEGEGGETAGVEHVRPTISDGNHVSVRWKRVTLGGTWEHNQFRENEWKGGSRLAIRILRHASAMLYVLTPGRTEFRGGILIHPKPD
jgi:hypothetical protein